MRFDRSSKVVETKRQAALQSPQMVTEIDIIYENVYRNSLREAQAKVGFDYFGDPHPVFQSDNSLAVAPTEQAPTGDDDESSDLDWDEIYADYMPCAVDKDTHDRVKKVDHVIVLPGQLRSTFKDYRNKQRDFDVTCDTDVDEDMERLE
jgi:hypothetical protein